MASKTEHEGSVVLGAWPADRRLLLPPLSVAIPLTVVAVAALALPLAVAERLNLSQATAGTWLLALYVLPGLLSVGLTVVFRQPLLVACHTALLVFFAGQAGRFGFAELQGATLIGGLAVAMLGFTGLTGRLAGLVPVPVVFGVVAGSVLPFVERTFDALGQERFVVGAALGAWLIARSRFGSRVPAILPALVVGVAVAGATGRLATFPGGWTLPALHLTKPHFSVEAILTVAPVFVALVALHANLTSQTYLRSAGYDPPVRAIEVATGLGSVAGSFVGPVPICMASLLTPLTAGPEAGERPVRVWSVYGGSVGFIAIGLLGGVAAGLPKALPLALLVAVVGLALVSVLGQALGEVTHGPMTLGPLLAFAVTGSQFTFSGLSAPFWALILGTVTARFFEREASKRPG